MRRSSQAATGGGDPAHGDPARRAGPVAGVVLAAGRSTRMGAPKALLDANGATFLARLAHTLRRGGCDPVVAVAASEDGAVAAEARRARAETIVNPGGEGGQIGSLRAALAHLRAVGEPPAAVLFTPVDNPVVAVRTVRAVIAAWRSSRAAIVTPSHRGTRGHPVLADMGIAHEFLEEGLAEGARTVVRRDSARVRVVAVPDPGVADDIDTPGGYDEAFPAAAGAAPGAAESAPQPASTVPEPPSAPRAPRSR